MISHEKAAMYLPELYPWQVGSFVKQDFKTKSRERQA
jgi:transposase